jgi:trehalose 6-phosphate phosphatase
VWCRPRPRDREEEKFMFDMSAIEILRAHAGEAILVWDCDGVLCKIVKRAKDSVVEPEMQARLRHAAQVYRAQAVLTGRTAEEVRRVVGLPELDYLAMHGAQWLPAGGDPTTAELDERFVPWVPRAQSFMGAVQAVMALAGCSELGRWFLEQSEIRPEVKMGCMLALHYRGAPDRELAHQTCEVIELIARQAGFKTRLALETLEIVPPIPQTKKDGVKQLVKLSGARYALYAGDGETDCDAFDGLDEMVAGGELRGAVKVAVRSVEVPARLVAGATVVVDGVEGVEALLDALVA